MVKQNDITITNDSGHLSKEEIEKMTQDAEKYAEEDNKFRQALESKNKLENYIFQIKGVINDEKFKDKISEEDKTILITETDNSLKWLEGNSSAEKELYDEQLKDLESKCSSIMSKLYQNAMPEGMPEECQKECLEECLECLEMPGMPGMPGGMLWNAWRNASSTRRRNKSWT